MAGVRLLVPVKSLGKAKTRLRAVTGRGLGLRDGTEPGTWDSAADGAAEARAAHGRLSLALARDTIAAARAADGVHEVVAITSDRTVAAALRRDGVEVLLDGPERGLNAALRTGARVLAARSPALPVGALQADLPALRPHELADALSRADAAMRAGATRVFCPDAPGEGTTLLLTAPGVALAPRFGPGSAAEHERGGAVPLHGHWPGLHRDVDTPDDLRVAAELGLGPATRAALDPAVGHPCPATRPGG